MHLVLDELIEPKAPDLPFVDLSEQLQHFALVLVQDPLQPLELRSMEGRLGVLRPILEQSLDDALEGFGLFLLDAVYVGLFLLVLVFNLFPLLFLPLHVLQEIFQIDHPILF